MRFVQTADIRSAELQNLMDRLNTITFISYLSVQYTIA